MQAHRQFGAYQRQFASFNRSVVAVPSLETPLINLGFSGRGITWTWPGDAPNRTERDEIRDEDALIHQVPAKFRDEDALG